jgi:hypothetical protein
LFDRKTAISSSRPASWQSAARSGSQRCRREASLTERARCYACPGGTTPQRYPAGLLRCFFRLIIGGRSAPSGTV